MDFEDACRHADIAIQRVRPEGEGLRDIERIVLEGSWHKKTYEGIADGAGYSPGYLSRDIGPTLWRDLSVALDINVSKKNFRTAIERWVSQNPELVQQTPSITTRPKLIIQTMQRVDRQFFAERLPDLEAAPTEALLKMVQIPGGSFWMGSPEDELDRYDDEGPQYEVTVPAFFMGMTPITQIQWRAVAQLPTINRTLEPEPSHFKGEHHPVEQVSWHEAMEFCGRLSEYSGREYRLPTEAEWEYACRAGTTSPFHYGETITTDLANYRGTDNQEHGWSGSYGRGPKGEYRETTTEVGIFPANGFGLYDMHGNVWEWCLDHWHDNYEGSPPTDGSAWIEAEAEESRSRVLRGGSWYNGPRYCRSACRSLNAFPVVRNSLIGFRVVCAAARTLP